MIERPGLDPNTPLSLPLAISSLHPRLPSAGSLWGLVRCTPPLEVAMAVHSGEQTRPDGAQD